MKDLYNANAMNERVGAFVSALDSEYDNSAGFHFLTTLVVDRTPDPATGKVQPTLVVVAQGPGLWTTRGPPLHSDGEEPILRSRRVLPTGRRTVTIEIQGIKCGYLLPWAGFPVDTWQPVSHQPFSTLTGHHYGETSIWRLSNTLDFPDGLFIHFVFDVPFKEHLQRRFARYESFGAGIGRSTFAPAVRASPVRPRVFNDDSSLMRSQQWTTGPPKDVDGESVVSAIAHSLLPPKRAFSKDELLGRLEQDIGQFLLTFDVDHVVKPGWAIKGLQPDNRTVVVEGVEVYQFGYFAGIRRYFCDLPGYPTSGDGLLVLHEPGLFSRPFKHSLRWQFDRRELSKAERGWRRVVATEWRVEGLSDGVDRVRFEHGQHSLYRR